MYFGDLKHPYQNKIYKKIERPPIEDIDIIASTYTGFVVDRLGKLGLFDEEIKPISPTMRVCGPAVTVLGPDLALRRAASDLAEPGDVLVIAAGSKQYACFGDGTARKMRLGGLAGVVIDGMTRDAGRIAGLGFPCFCRGTTLHNFEYPAFPNFGSINVPVSCGNQLVNPGDLIFGDADGVVVIPRAFVPDLAAGLQEDLISETRERLDLQRGYRFDELGALESSGFEIIEGSFE